MPLPLSVKSLFVMTLCHTFYAYGLVCPKAAGIIHLGATSCYVGDNTDVIIMRDALKVVKRKLVKVIDQLAKFADKYKAMPCLAYTHLQPAQLTTVGKRATLWCNELLMDLEDLDFRLANLKLLGSKGTTGTQASFMELFHGDTDKVKELEKMIAEEMALTLSFLFQVRPIQEKWIIRYAQFSPVSLSLL